MKIAPNTPLHPSNTLPFVRVFFVFSLLIAALVGLPDEASALSVSPVRIEAESDPGTTFEGELLLFNEQQEEKTFYASFEKFDASGESGTPSFMPATDGLATWIQTPSSVTLKPGEQLKVPYAIHIPEAARAGGYFAAIFWGTAPPEANEGGNVSVGAKVGVLVLLKVSGEIAEGGGLIEFHTTDNNAFFSSFPIAFTYRFSNDGGDRIKPLGDLTIKNMFGGTTAVLDANRRDGNILPSSIRKFEIIWATKEQERLDVVDPAVLEEERGFFATAKHQLGNFALGRYTAHLDLEYGSGEQVSRTYSFFIVPWQLLSLVFGSLLFLVLFIWFGLRRYNRWITGKTMRQAESMMAAREKQNQDDQPTPTTIKTRESSKQPAKRVPRKRAVTSSTSRPTRSIRNTQSTSKTQRSRPNNEKP